MRPILIAALLLATTSAFADQPVRPTAGQGVGLSPIINDLLPDQKVATVRVSNQTDCAAPFQFSVTQWTQKDGLDVDTPTDKVRAVPAIATIPAGGTQIVRIARMAPPNGSAEEAYRLDVQQMPGSCPTKPGTGPTLKMLYHLQSPIFYRGPAWKADLHAVWVDGKLKLRNDGQATADVFGVTANDQAWVARSLHVLPGSSIEVAPRKGPASKPTVIDVKTLPTTTVPLPVE